MGRPREDCQSQWSCGRLWLHVADALAQGPEAADSALAGEMLEVANQLADAAQFLYLPGCNGLGPREGFYRLQQPKALGVAHCVHRPAQDAAALDGDPGLVEWTGPLGPGPGYSVRRVEFLGHTCDRATPEGSVTDVSGDVAQQCYPRDSQPWGPDSG